MLKMKTVALVTILALLGLNEAAGVRNFGGPQCGTCVNACGQPPNPQSRTRSCGCDVNCVALDDCCPDLPDTCPDIYANATTKDFYPDTRGQCQEILVKEKSGHYKFNHYALISTCPTNETACSASHGSAEERLASKVPVLDTATNISFVNAACAVCNGVQNAIPWSVRFICNKYRVDYETNTKYVINGTATQSYIETLMASCDVYMQPPPEAVLHWCIAKIDDCPSDNVTLQEKCYSPFQQLTKTQEIAAEVYHNQGCAECYNLTGWCGRPNVALLGVSPSTIGAYSLALLVDFTHSKGLLIGRKYCRGDQIWSEIHLICVPLVCRQGYEPVDGQCVSYMVEGFMNFTMHLTLVHTTKSYMYNMSEHQTWKMITENASNSLELYLQQQIPLVNWTVSGLVMRFSESANSIYSECLVTYMYIYSNKEYHLQADENKFHRLAINIFRETFEKLAINQTEHYATSHFGIALGDLIGSGESRDYDCHRHRLKKDRFMIKDEVLTVHGLGREYLPFEYVLEDGGDALVCTYSQEFTSLRFSNALGIFTIVCLTISLVCLAVRLFLHVILPIYHTFPMRLQALMCLSMFFAFLGFLLMPSVEDYFYPCYAMGVATHFGFLSFYCWLAAIAAHTWVSFLPSSSFIKTSQQDARLWPRMLFAWGLPLAIIIAAVAVDQVSPNYDMRPGYGLFRCWFNRKMPLLFFFVVPLACIVVANLFFFVSTVFHLQKGFRDCNVAVKKSKLKQFKLFTKLFVIMGLTEILSFIAPFVDSIWLWFVYIGFNGTLGLFILWAFVLTKPVMKDAKSWWQSNVSKDVSTSNTSTSQTRSDQTTKTTISKSMDDK